MLQSNDTKQNYVRTNNAVDEVKFYKVQRQSQKFKTNKKLS